MSSTSAALAPVRERPSRGRRHLLAAGVAILALTALGGPGLDLGGDNAFTGLALAAGAVAQTAALPSR